ncbi:MAG TPA: Fe(3+) ABC transporter substrate-binding protein, partial [Halomonas sp.]|nr:Fe(3+) ABC transporter substrate-binding protein [Halomonas sp.]
MLKRSLCSAVTLASIALSTSLLADDKLVLYTSQPNSDAQQTVDAFQAAYPEIEVEWVRDGTTRLMTRLR